MTNKDNWDKLKFEDFVEINPRISLKKNKSYPYIPMEDVIPGERYIRPKREKVLKGSGAKFRNEDILFARITPCLENGKITQVRGMKNNYGIGSTEFFVFRNKPELSDLSYLYYLIISDNVRRPAEKSMIGASGRQRAQIEALRKIELVVPPLQKQQQIGNFLSLFDNLIYNNIQRIYLLEKITKLIFIQWFIKFKFPGHGNEKFVKTKLGEIPSNFDLIKLGKLIQQKRINVNPVDLDPETPYLGLKHFPSKSICLMDWGKALEINSTKFEFDEFDILFGKIRPYLHKVGFAPLKGICSSDTIIIKPLNPFYYSYILLIVSSNDFINYANLTSKGTKMPRADWDALIQYDLILPPIEILKDFNEIILNILKKIQELILKNSVLKKTVKHLNSKIILGEIDIKYKDK